MRDAAERDAAERDADAPRAAVLDPIDRASEVVFGLLMSLSFTGALSVASAGRDEIRTMLASAVGCNLAWGLVDAVMFVVRARVARGHRAALAERFARAGDAAEARAVLGEALPGRLAAALPEAALERLRAMARAAAPVPASGSAARDDLRAAFGVFALVVAATFPVVLPFVLLADAATALRVSNGLAIALLFGAGAVLGRYAGWGAARTGFAMVALGAAMVATIRLLGG
ncbi:MAG: hypothetical protein EHM87_00290 [Burkholderiales bacterium]|nr:MAG: hypothetical protein EHM87_00290 [Burkholderiales bacterium]